MPAAERDSNLKPDIALSTVPAQSGLYKTIAHLTNSIGKLIEETTPDLLIVQGDTGTTLAGAISATMLQVPVVHVEAGVRSTKRDEPFPEDVIRRTVSQLADYHICFEESAQNNLITEGVEADNIYLASHPIQDHIRTMLDVEEPHEVRNQILITFHRRERRSERQQSLMSTLRLIRRNAPRTDVVLVDHPSVDWKQHEATLSELSIIRRSPFAPREFLAELAASACLVTDSAGALEEATRLGVPVVNFRNCEENRQLGTGPSVTTESVHLAADYILDHLTRASPNRKFSFPDAAGDVLTTADVIIKVAARL